MAFSQCVICGSVAIDTIMSFGGQYRDLIEASNIEVLSVSVLVESLHKAEGGTGANIAYNLAALGDKPVLLGSVGSDAAAYVARLAAVGVDTTHMHQSELPTASFNVLTDSIGNQVGGFYPGAMTDATSLSFVPWAGQNVIACISAHDPAAMRRQVEECVAHQLRVVYDPGQQVSNVSANDLLAGVGAAEVLIVNEYELGMLCQKTGMEEAALVARVPILITTHGKHGSTMSGSRLAAPINISSVKPRQISDPTGAGDAYRAGFLYGYLRQWDVRECGQLGSTLASFALEQHGPQATVSKQSITERYQAAFNERVAL